MYAYALLYTLENNYVTLRQNYKESTFCICIYAVEFQFLLY